MFTGLQRSTSLSHLFVSLLIVVAGCSESPEQPKYVGRQVCAECHQAEVDSFHGSDHDLSMDTATEETVLGDFRDATFIHHGVESRFYRKNGAFVVRTEGIGGITDDFEIRYTFGVHPLQQYLVEMEGGRIQCLPLCWDSRPEEEGGQRWFHIYDTVKIGPDDMLYWTRADQRWNYMCAECHSTNLRKNFDAESATYSTTWSEIDVSCEACHGPGADHAAWGRKVQAGSRDPVPGKGLLITMKESDGGNWVFSDTSTSAARVPARKESRQIEMCARCHSRRSVITEDYQHGRPLADTHHPVSLTGDLYFADGQILDEVYVYGSFLQSRMFRKGVVCTDCHDAHTTRVYADGNALCFRCHKVEIFDRPEHHHHPVGSTGAECVSCHMPARNYMVVDPRRDHSFRVPRPDLSAATGSPNPCTSCHNDRPAEELIRSFRNWYGSDLPPHYGEILADARMGKPGWSDRLRTLIDAPDIPPIVLATAVTLYSRRPDEAAEVIRTVSGHPDPLVRSAAASLAESLPVAERIPVTVPFLTDSVRLVRIPAARSLAGIPLSGLTPGERVLLKDGLAEYRASLLVTADHPASLFNLGNLALAMEDTARAETALRKAISLEPAFMPAYVNLADLYRLKGRDDQGLVLLKNALDINRSDAGVHHAIGLLLTRVGNPDTALVYFRRAAELGPENARYRYVYGIALHSASRTAEAVDVLEGALLRFPFDSELLYALASIENQRGGSERALAYVRRLRALYPHDRQIEGFEHSLEQTNKRNQ